MTRQTYRYRQCVISRTWTREGSTGRHVYAVSGRYTHPAGPRPFLITLAAARAWIELQDNDAALATY
ncbi:MAG: hypothetical protein IPL76_10435 [Gemmatimonadetes bacterium]|nr:hypothetical protein [Gemmatimonadota bacterium]